MEQLTTEDAKYWSDKRILDNHKAYLTGNIKDGLEAEALLNVAFSSWEKYCKELGKDIIFVDNLVEIKLPGLGRLISEFAKDVAEVLKDKKRFFYRDNINAIVTISDGTFKIINKGNMVTLLESYIKPLVFDNQTLTWKKRSISTDLANTLLQSSILQDALPKIERIFNVPMPLFYEGRLTFPEKGYDSRFKSWLQYDSPEIEKMPLEEARQLIDLILKEFCFKSPKDKINAIAGLITPFLRGLYSNRNERTPFFFYQANRERSGKDYLAGITGILYEGYASEEAPIGDNDELRKKIISSLLMGKTRIHFANNKGYINSSVLEWFLTAKRVIDRLLGKNEEVSLDNEIEISGSGNVGVGFTADLANRAKNVNLFLEIEDANSRVFQNPNLHKWILNNRSRILSALYSLINNWYEQGMKPGEVPFASFPEWARVCGGIMESAGYENPCIPDVEMLAIGGDNETKDMKTLFEICYQEYPEAWLDLRNIKDVVFREGLFPYIDLETLSGKTKFGLILTRFIGRYLSNIRLFVQDKNVRSARQRYKFTKDFGTLGNLGNVLLADYVQENIIIEGKRHPTVPTVPTKICSKCQKNQAVIIKDQEIYCADCIS